MFFFLVERFFLVPGGRNEDARDVDDFFFFCHFSTEPGLLGCLTAKVQQEIILLVFCDL